MTTEFDRLKVKLCPAIDDLLKHFNDPLYGETYKTQVMERDTWTPTGEYKTVTPEIRPTIHVAREYSEDQIFKNYLELRNLLKCDIK